jgi:hypothetical protein
MSLAAKLPWNHRFAGGFPGLSSQPLPTDADAIDYLSRMAAADGAGVETGVAVAVDAFFAALKATPGLFDAIKASCILAGARTITGALVPLAGPAPTAQGAWASGDYSRTAGMTGNGITLYLDTNVANDSDFGGSVADPQNDHHLAVFQTSPQIGNPKYIAGRGIVDAGTTTLVGVASATNKLYTRSRNSVDNGGAAGLSATGLLGMSRSASDNYDVRVNSNASNTVQDSQTPLAGNIWVFRSNNVGAGSSYDGTLSFYSIGTSLDLAKLDTAVTNLLTAIGEAL